MVASSLSSKGIVDHPVFYFATVHAVTISIGMEISGENPMTILAGAGQTVRYAPPEIYTTL
jgi:hypothetical protein